MKQFIYALILPLVVVSGFVFANRENKKSAPKPRTAAEMNAEKKKWEATPDGIRFNEWKASPQGQKVLAGTAKIKSHIKTSAPIEAVVTSLTLPPGSRLGFGVMVRINGDDYIMNFRAKKADELQQLRSLKVNDTIIIKSHFVSYAPKYDFPIVSADYVERDHQVVYVAPPQKGC